MEYIFKLSKNNVSVHFNNIVKDPSQNIAGIVSFWLGQGNNHREFVRTVRIGKDGRNFFTWNKKKFYMDEFEAYSPKALIEKFKTDRVWGNILCNTLEKYGLDSLIVSIKTKKLERFAFGGLVLSFKTTSSLDCPEDFDWVDYKFVPEYLCNPQDGYKLKLIPLQEELQEIYPSERYYVDDLCSLIAKCDEFEIKLPESKGE